jgi:hypothetical protein
MNLFSFIMKGNYQLTTCNSHKEQSHCWREALQVPLARWVPSQGYVAGRQDYLAVVGNLSKGRKPWIKTLVLHETMYPRVEAGSNTSTVTLRVVGGDEKGSLESEKVKYDHESHGTRTREWLRWRSPAAIVNDRPVLSLERVPHFNKPTTVWQ